MFHASHQGVKWRSRQSSGCRGTKRHTKRRRTTSVDSVSAGLHYLATSRIIWTCTQVKAHMFVWSQDVMPPSSSPAASPTTRSISIEESLHRKKSSRESARQNTKKSGWSRRSSQFLLTHRVFRTSTTAQNLILWNLCRAQQRDLAICSIVFGSSGRSLDKSQSTENFPGWTWKKSSVLQKQ